MSYDCLPPGAPLIGFDDPSCKGPGEDGDMLAYSEGDRADRALEEKILDLMESHFEVFVLGCPCTYASFCDCFSIYIYMCVCDSCLCCGGFVVSFAATGVRDSLGVPGYRIECHLCASECRG